MATKLHFARIHDEAKTPVRKHETDAGVDVFADKTVEIPPFSAGIVPTGLTFEIHNDFMLLARPKSGSNFLLGAGVIDPGYQGEILIKVINYGPEPLKILKGSAVAQLIQVAILTEPLQEVELLELHPHKSARAGDGGIVRELT